jgi:hypothetical protein
VRRGIVALAVAAIALLAGCAESHEEASRLQSRAEATATVDRKDIAFGDDLTLTLEVRSDPTFEIELPRTSEFDGFRLIDSGSTDSEIDGVLVERRWLRLRAERAGPQTLPALEVRYRPAAAGSKASTTSDATAKDAGADWKTVSTAPISFDVRSLLPAGDQPPQIREIKPLQPIQRARPWLWIAVATALVLVLAAALAYWWRRRRAPEETLPQVPAVPAHEIALAALDRLAASEPIGDAAVRRYYFALSEIIRAYIEGRFGLNATDLTTEEIVASLDRRDVPDLPEAPARGLRAFLSDTDAVKFAAHRPQRAEIGAVLDWARRFVEMTRQIEPAAGTVEASREAA